MRRGVDYYGVLGVDRAVEPAELKARFRQLARRLHPDVAEDPESAQKQFILVVEAYNVLNDPAKRRAYDALRAGDEPLPSHPVDPRQRQIDDWFRHAVHAMEQGDLAAAAAQCRKILAIDPEYGAAHALLGDVFATRQAWDDAVTHFSGAVAAAPRNVVYARKLRSALESGQAARGSAERELRRAAKRQRALQAFNARHEWLPYSFIMASAWVVALLVWGVLNPGHALVDWLPLPANLAYTAAGTGLLLGVMLADVGIRTEPRTTLVSVLLGVLAAVLFYLSGVAFLVWSLIRGRFNHKLTALYLTSLVLTLGLAGITSLASASSGGSVGFVALFAGNLIFPLTLIGHKLGMLGLRTRQ